jgi:hypothetical protein
MSPPIPAEPGTGESISVRPAALQTLAAELSALAGELEQDAELCRAAAHSFATALGGAEGWTAGASATAWASLEEALADGARALAGTLSAAVARYAAEDHALSARIRSGRSHRMPGCS